MFSIPVSCRFKRSALAALLWFSALTALTAVSATAAPVSVQATALDLAGAVEKGLANSPLVHEAREKLNQTRYEKYQSRSALLPVIGLTANSTYRKDSVADKTLGSVPFGGSPYNIYTVGVRGEQTLLAYGMFSGVAQAEVQREIDLKNLDIARRDLVRDIITAFYGTLLNENRVRLLEDQEKSMRDVLSIAQRRLALGGRRIDVLQVRTKLALLKAEIVRARNALMASTAQLANLIGRGDASELKIRGQVPSLTIKDVEKRLNFKDFEILELKRLRLQRDGLHDQKTAALGKHLPKLMLVGDYNFVNYSKSALFEDAANSWSVQLVLNVPLFSGFSSLSELRSFTSQDAQLEARERNEANRVRLMQVNSRKELESVEANLVHAVEGAKLAKESLREARREYQAGLMDFVQYFKVETDSFDAEISLLQLRYEAIQAYGNYFASSGQPLSVLVDLLTQEGSRL